MERFFLVIGAGLLSVSAAYAQIPHCSVQCSDVSNLVCSLPANYDPTGTTPLACDPLNPVSPTYVTKINDAFKAGNGTVAGLQKCLCSLKNILVHNNITYGGWGKWENPNRSRASKKGRSRSDDSFIALHVNDLNTTVKDQQDAHLRALNIPVSVAYHTETNGSAIDSATLAILYALAHEMGT